MRSYAFLGSGAVSIFSGRALPAPTGEAPGAWFTGTPGELLPLTLKDLPRRLDEELWEIQVGRTGCSPRRLLRRVETWTQAVARDLADTCAWRARDQAVRVLERHGEHKAARELGAVERFDDVERWAAAAAVERLPDHAALAADAAALARGSRPESWLQASAPRASQPAAVTAANLCFVVAHGAGLEASDRDGPRAYPGGVDAERAWQADWLAARLGLLHGSMEPESVTPTVTPARR